MNMKKGKRASLKGMKLREISLKSKSKFQTAKAQQSQKTYTC